jgi:GTP-binding protein
MRPILEKKPIVALSGRSNVGKSSLLNRLLGRPVARVSQKPGCTRQIQLYPAQEGWLWADLPGYGYAQVDQKKRLLWLKNTEHFLKEEAPLTCVLIDSRIPPQKLDQIWVAWLGSHNLPFVILANKVDSLSQKERYHQQKLLIKAFPEPLYWGWVSAKTGEGVPAFLEWLKAYWHL